MTGVLVILAPAGIIAGLAALRALVDLRRARWLVASVLFLTSLGVAFDYFGNPNTTWLRSLQEVRSTAFLCLGVAMTLALSVNARKIRTNRIGGIGWSLLSIGLYQGLLRVFHEGGWAGLGSLAFTAATAGSMLLLLRISLTDHWTAIQFIRAFVWASVAWNACCVLQLVIEPGHLLLNGRFTGLTANPQAAAMFLSIEILLHLFLLVWTRLGPERGLVLANAVLSLGFLFWTGSRTGLLALLVGTVVLFRGSLRRFVWVLPAGLVAILLVVGILVSMGRGDLVERVLSSDDSGRMESMRIMWESGLAEPFVGSGVSDTKNTVNSFLLGFSSFGVGMVVLLVGLSLFIGRDVSQLRRLARKYQSIRPACDLVVAFFSAYLVVACFEGIMLGRVREMQVFALFFAAFGGMIVRGGPIRSAGVMPRSAVGRRLPSRAAGPATRRSRDVAA